MKKLIGLTALIGGFLLLVTPRYILPACEYEGFNRMHCSDTARAEFVTGAILMAVGALTLALKGKKTTLAGAGIALPLFVAAYILPDKFGYCMSSRMPCNYGMVPGIRFIAVIGALIVLGAFIGSVRQLRKKGTV